MISRCAVILDILDPRGRCNRIGLAATLGLMMVVEAAMGALYVTDGGDASATTTAALKVALLYVGAVGASKRLHDLGLSAWWALVGFAGFALWTAAVAVTIAMNLGPQALAPGSTLLPAVMVACVLPGLFPLLWLHFARGEPAPNRFGPFPHGAGFARHRRDRPVPAVDPMTVDA